MADTTSEDFLYSSPVDSPAYGEPAAVEAPPGRRIPPMLMTGGWLALGLVVGVLAMTVLHSNRSTNATRFAPAAVGNPQAPGVGAQGFAGPGFAGPAGGGARGGGGFDGEQHVFGTLTAVGAATVTLRSASGTTTTYRIDSTTQLVKNGQQVSSLSAMHVGDSVLVHAYQLNGSTHVERVIDGVPTTT